MGIACAVSSLVDLWVVERMDILVLMMMMMMWSVRQDIIRVSDSLRSSNSRTPTTLQNITSVTVAR